MITKKTWEEFRSSGLLWFINKTLHIFGWAIVVEIENDQVKNCYPARVKFRGFTEDDETEGYQKVSKYLKDNINEIEEETRE
jgi:hypothetical protein